MKKIIFAVLFTAYVLLVAMSCSPIKEGCPAAHSNGIMKGKFKG